MQIATIDTAMKHVFIQYYKIIHLESTSSVVWFVSWSVPALLKYRKKQEWVRRTNAKSLRGNSWEENHLQILRLLFLPPCRQKHFAKSCHELSSGTKRKLLNETQISDILSILLSVMVLFHCMVRLGSARSTFPVQLSTTSKWMVL